MKVGLYFGSFNPIHIGHLIIAEFVANNTDVDQVWLVVSPQNPLKPSSTLLNEHHRLHLTRLAVADNPQLKVSNIEFNLPRPSFTIDTLAYLSDKYPKHTFSVIIGSDSYQNLPKWKNFQVLLNSYEVVVYERPGYAVEVHTGRAPKVLKAPMLDISSTFIRQLIKEGKSARYMLPEEVRMEIEAQSYYRG